MQSPDDGERRRLGVPRQGDLVVLQVRDTGCGMDDETVSRIFEPFYTTKQHGQGTGLGLSIVYNAVKQCGGRIDVQSKPGGGTTFSIYLPSSAEAVESTSKEAPAPASRGCETILLVEDEAALRRLVKRNLEDQGYRVLLAGDGVEAQELAEAHAGEINLLLTDVVMPRLGGQQLALRLRDRFPGLRTLFVSGYPRGTSAAPGTPLPAHLLLSKPFDRQQLLARVRAVLDAPGPED
jgi:CheY-like chemotaxis protein